MATLKVARDAGIHEVWGLQMTDRNAFSLVAPGSYSGVPVHFEFVAFIDKEAAEAAAKHHRVECDIQCEAVRIA